MNEMFMLLLRPQPAGQVRQPLVFEVEIQGILDATDKEIRQRKALD